MGTLVLDSSVVIGFSRPGDALHESAVAEIRAARIRDNTLVLPASVLAEALVAAYRVGTATGDTTCQTLVSLFGPVRVADEEVVVAAATLRAETPSVRLPDALVVATGIVDDATVLTYDKRLAAVDERVWVLQA